MASIARRQAGLIAASVALSGPLVIEADRAKAQVVPPSILAPFLEPTRTKPTGSRVVERPSESPRTALPIGGAMAPTPWTGDDLGPPDGLTLDAAIARLLAVNPTLRAKAQEIPKARADVLSAGLIGNPFVFAAAETVPYGNYSEQRPGADEYLLLLIQPIELGGQRRKRVAVRRWTLSVAEAEFQDTVRLRIDDLGQVYIDALAAREAVRSAVAGLAELDTLIRAMAEQAGTSKPGEPPPLELDRALLDRDRTIMELERAAASMRQARHTLARLLAMPPAEADQLALRGTLHDRAGPIPHTDDLVRIALAVRPDLEAVRRDVKRAEADIVLARSEAIPELFLFYTPVDYLNNSRTGKEDATSWGLGGLMNVPLFDRNQGNVRKASHDAIRARIEQDARVRQVVSEVHRAADRYHTSLETVRRFERSTLPRARRLRDHQRRRLDEGRGTLSDAQNAQSDYNEMARLYFDALIEHRRSMLRLNTAVGRRILP